MNDDDLTRYMNACDAQGFYQPETDWDIHLLRKRVREFEQELRTLSPQIIPAQFDQDCTYFARIGIPGELNPNGQGTSIYISNFGYMTAVENEAHMSPVYLAAIQEVAQRHGLYWIRESYLRRDYDGKACRGFETWWHRFFDYV